MCKPSTSIIMGTAFALPAAMVRSLMFISRNMPLTRALPITSSHCMRLTGMMQMRLTGMKMVIAYPAWCQAGHA